MKKKGEMSLFGHLDELRKRLTVIVVVTLAVSAFLFTKAGMVMDYFLAFVEKGLYKKEKIYILITLIFGTIFFAAGVAFCYFMVLPTTLGFFMRIAIEDVTSMISIKSYISFINTMLLCFGAVFEMPVLVFLLSKLEILKPQFLKANRGLFIIAIFILAAVITPPDVVSQLMLAVPMVLLFQFSTFVCVVVDKTNRRKHSDSDDSAENTEDKCVAAD